MLSAGGGGWGDPLERDPQAVLEDIHNEMATVERAREWYGVVITEGQVDGAATEKLRMQMRAANGKS